jgi:hypothetical protein
MSAVSRTEARQRVDDIRVFEREGRNASRLFAIDTGLDAAAPRYFQPRVLAMGVPYGEPGVAALIPACR